MDQIEKIAAVLRRGGLVVMRSDTVYGIFASALDVAAADRLHKIRRRPDEQGFIVLCDSVEAVAGLVKLRPEISRKLKNLWPNDDAVKTLRGRGENYGATTAVLPADGLKQTWLADRRGENPTIAFRVPFDLKLRKLLRSTGPLLAPSANLPDQLPAQNIAQAKNYFDAKVDLYVDGGECQTAIPSRIIEFQNGQVKTLRGDGRPHPEDRILTRRRKLFRFARFDEMENCWQLDQWIKNRGKILRGVSQNLTIEVGAGDGNFAFELSRQNPAKFVVAVDKKSDRLYQGARRAAELKLKNIAFVRADAAKLGAAFDAKSASEIWLTFPDPFAAEAYQKLAPAEIKNLGKLSDAVLAEKFLKKSDASHRLTAPNFLKIYRKILRAGGTLHFKTDNLPLFVWSLNQFEKAGWLLEFQTRDLTTANDAPAAAKIPTTYESKFSARGIKICYAKFSKCQATEEQNVKSI
ncbi:MAG: Sua5/YciO/YrdC/YwlC family protein [Candidatus Nomurabacteria bacterium]|jgi:tRNA (guanine-N7-)-methyltransferase|nr:Sua5/YciO/YrdC/YwlC family protein [Candidatus Nomurabacteria bacterium]